MKHTFWIGCAAAAGAMTCSGAFAQSSVTLYGNLDAALL
ncbi:hypothetical protein BURMUCF2_B0434 [Burkholderia multivorans CF2]|nr:hypothetical protein BURMUCF2_B0434 [Burkholderia multivorans CF2]